MLNETSPTYFRIFGWWLLVQSWSALRFSDHRGIIPTRVELDEKGFTTKLTHSKTLGSDRSVKMRLVVISCLRHGWMAAGWSLLRREAPFERDYLFPAPTGNYGSRKRQELRYAVGSAIQTSILSIVKGGDEPLFRHRVVHNWTPRSGRNFLPSATGALGFSQQERDVFRRRSAQGSERYKRLARQRISVMSAVVKAHQGHVESRPIVRGRVAKRPCPQRRLSSRRSGATGSSSADDSGRIGS